MEFREVRSNTYIRSGDNHFHMQINGPSRQAVQWKSIYRVSIVAAWLTMQPAAAVETGSCSNPNLEVSGASSELRHEVCAGAELALEFLSGYGVQAKYPVRIVVVEQPLRTLTYSACGSYDSRRDLVEVMSPQAIHKHSPSPKIFYQKLDRVQYRGIVAHEVAHALMQQNSQVLPLPLGTAAQEYLATVTQLSIMPPAIRDHVIRTAGVGPWKSGDVISCTYMAMAPACFAVKSYLHFRQHPDPAQFVNKLLRSKSFNVNVE